MRITILAIAILLAACGGGEEGGNSNNSSEATGSAPIEQQPSNLQDDPNNSVVPLSSPTPIPSASSTPAA